MAETIPWSLNISLGMFSPCCQSFRRCTYHVLLQCLNICLILSPDLFNVWTFLLSRLRSILCVPPFPISFSFDLFRQTAEVWPVNWMWSWLLPRERPVELRVPKHGKSTKFLSTPRFQTIFWKSQTKIQILQSLQDFKQLLNQKCPVQNLKNLSTHGFFFKQKYSM